MDEKKFTSTLKKFFANRKMTQDDVAATLKVSRVRVNNLLNGKSQFGGKVSREWSAAFGFDPVWLLTGGTEGTPPDEPTAPAQSARPAAGIVYNAPLVPKYMHGGFASGYGDDEYVAALPRYPFIIDGDTLPRGEYYAFEVKGESMDDGTDRSIKEGDICLCRVIAPHLYRDAPLHFRKWLFALVTNDGIVIKQITKHDTATGMITLHSYNPLYPDKELKLADVKMVLNVVRCDRRPIIY